MRLFDGEIRQGSEIVRPFQPKYTQSLTHPSGMTVELLDTLGDDLAIVNAARVSYGKETWWHEEFWDREAQAFIDTPIYYGYPPTAQKRFTLSSTDFGVLNYMMRERHGSPFEMVVLKFRVKAPIGVIWEWVRHRIASYNIMSTRYVEWDKDYYIPEAKEWRTQIGKAGRYTFVPMDPDLTERVRTRYIQAMEDAFSHYGWLVEEGLAKEVARNVLPMGAMTQMIWCVNARSLMNFLSLRNEEHALQEIQICASMVEKLTQTIIPDTMKLWNEYERKTP